MALPALSEPKTCKLDNGEACQGAFDIDPDKVYKISAASSTDAFASKTNKFAESRLVRITTFSKGVHILWSAAGTAADTDDYLQLADTTREYVVNEGRRCLRLIQEAATAEIYVTEL